MDNKVIEYDKKGRVVFFNIIEPNISYKFLYGKLNRICIIESNINCSNHKSIIYQIGCDGAYKEIKNIEIGEIYDSETVYDESGKEVLVKRFNKIKNTKYLKKNLIDSNGEVLIWAEKYNEEFNFNFKVKKNLLKTWINKKNIIS
jgi:hypothetical protein